MRRRRLIFTSTSDGVPTAKYAGHTEILEDICSACELTPVLQSRQRIKDQEVLRAFRQSTKQLIIDLESHIQLLEAVSVKQEVRRRELRNCALQEFDTNLRQQLGELELERDKVRGLKSWKIGRASCRERVF